MFKRIEGLRAAPGVTLSLDGRVIQAREGDTVALALLNAGIDVFRTTPVSGQARAPLCLMGVCFDCLVEVDGRPNVQACQMRVQPGMRVRLQVGARPVQAGPGDAT